MIDKIKTIFSIPELRDKIFFTFSILIVVVNAIQQRSRAKKDESNAK